MSRLSRGFGADATQQPLGESIPLALALLAETVELDKMRNHVTNALFNLLMPNSHTTGR